MTGRDEQAARRRAQNEIRKAREKHAVLVRAAQANGNEDQAAKLALPYAAKTFNT